MAGSFKIYSLQEDGTRLSVQATGNAFKSMSAEEYEALSVEQKKILYERTYS